MSGLLALFLFLGTAFNGLALLTGAGSGQASRTARLAAENGLEYAAARLWEDPRATQDEGVPLTPENARDDWTTRDPVMAHDPWPMASLNPSYARGDPWRDIDADGAYTVADAKTITDADGNGRFTVRSGRLREGSAFALRISASAALACVNSGELGSPTGDHDLDGLLDGGDPDYAADLDTDGIAANGLVPNGVPDWRDPDFHGNRHLVNLLDNLGAILEVASPRTTLYAPGAPAMLAIPAMGSITTSDLGRLVVAARPRGGYADVDAIADVLPSGEFARVAPYLTAHGVAAPIGWIQPLYLHPEDMPDVDLFYYEGEHPVVWPMEEPRYGFHVPVDFQRAPVEILQALLRHIAASGVEAYSSDGAFIRLGEDEADAIAMKLVEVRRARAVETWRDLLDVLHRDCSPLFTDDPFTDRDEKTDPLLIRRKEDLILAQAGPGGYFPDPHAWRRNTLEVSRDASLIGTDDTAPRGVPKSFLFGAPCLCPYDASGESVYDLLHSFSVPGRATTELVLRGRAPSHFRIASEGTPPDGRGALSAARADLSLGAGEIILESQQDFEQRGASPAAPWRLPGGHVRVEGPCQDKQSVETMPRYPLDAYDTAGLPGFPGVSGWMLDNEAYAGTDGDVRLKSRPTVLEELTAAHGCVFALPFDADPFPPPAQPPHWYDAARFDDNVGDPIKDLSASSDGRRGLLAANWENAARGYELGPQGPRRKTFAFISDPWCWQGPDHPFPLPLAHPNRIRNATITAWFAWQGGESAVPPIAPPLIELRVQHLPVPLRVSLLAGGQIQVKPFSSGAYTLPGSWLETPAQRRAAWRHLAIRFDEAGDKMEVFVDGRSQGTCSLFSPGNETPTEVWLLKLQGPFDDIRFHTPALPVERLADLAREDRYAAAQGTYVSPRFLIDAADLPRGAVIRGIAWDGFVPAAAAGGSIRLAVRGFDPAGNLVGQAAFPPWSGTGPPGGSCHLPGCLQVDAVAVLDAGNPEAIPVGTPPTYPNVLRDTPILASVRILYAGDRPRWTGLAGR